MTTDPDTAKPIPYGPAHVLPEWVDFNGHMNVAFYVKAFDEALDHVQGIIGIGTDYRAATRNSTMTLEMHVNYLKEILEAEPFIVDTYILGVDAKRLHVGHVMFHGETGDRLATSESMLVHVSLETRRSCPFPEKAAAGLLDWARRHEGFERPAEFGRAVGFGNRKVTA